MKIFKIIVMATFFSANAWAGTAAITWHEPGKYRDIRAAEELQTRFQERVFAEFEKHFNLLAAQLPENQTLKIIVTDVDLAGEVELQPMRGGLGSLRIVRGFDFPSIEFSYELVTAEGEVLVQGEERIRGRDVPGQGRPYRQSSSHDKTLDSERAMLDRWFRYRFEEQLK